MLLAISVAVLITYSFDVKDKHAKEAALEKQKEAILLEQLHYRLSQELVLPILVYHYVEIVTDVKDTIRKSLSITPAVFASQITTLLENGYTPIHLQDLDLYFLGQADLPVKPVVLTFDDGYRDFYTDVFPILKKHQVPATLYMVSGFLDYTHNYLTTAQLKEVAQSNLVEIGAHTLNHPNLLFLDTVTAEEEIAGSKRVLEAILGKPVNHFAYPYGGYNPTLAKLVQDAGFKTAVAVDRGINQTYAERFSLKRIRPGSFTGVALLQLLTSASY
jgi:peptidoglycan/xylan/chitin deacetylase (PgdA/CDA1 family)